MESCAGFIGNCSDLKGAVIIYDYRGTLWTTYVGHTDMPWLCNDQ